MINSEDKSPIKENQIERNLENLDYPATEDIYNQINWKISILKIFPAKESSIRIIMNGNKTVTSSEMI